MGADKEIENLGVCVYSSEPEIDNSPHVGPKPHGSTAVSLILAD